MSTAMARRVPLRVPVTSVNRAQGHFENIVRVEQPHTLKHRPRGSLDGGNRRHNMGADRIDYSNTEPVPLFEEEYDPQVSSRTSITTFVEDLKRKKYEFDRMSLLEGRKPLKPTSDVEVALGRECRANKYQRNAEDMVVVMDKVLQVSGLWSQHLVSSALSAAAACTHATKEEHLKTQLFEKGMDLFQRYLKKCKRNEVLPYAFSAAISLCAKAQKPDEAVKIYNLRKNYPLMKPDPYIYSSLIQALARGGKMKEAKEMFDRANSIFHHLDQRLVSQSLSLFSKKGNYKYCLEIFTKMLSKGLIPSTFDFNVLVDSCCQYKVPKKIFDLIFETKGQLAELGCFPNDYTYEALLRACYNNKNLKKAVELIEELNRNATSSHYYWLFKTVEKTMNNPEYSYDSDTKLSAEDRCTLCLDALSRLRGFGIDPSMAVLNKVFSIMLKAEKQVNALLFLKDLKDGWGRLPDHSTWFHFLEYLNSCKPETRKIWYSSFSRAGSDLAIREQDYEKLLTRCKNRPPELLQLLEELYSFTPRPESDH